jgi:hypothetical protein
VKIMLKAIAEAAKNMKDGTRTDSSMKSLINAYNSASRTPSGSPEQGRGSSSCSGTSKQGSKTRAEIFAAFGIPVQDGNVDMLPEEAPVLPEERDLECQVISDASASDAEEVRSCSAKDCKP